MKSPWQTAWEDLSDKGGSKVHIYGIGPGYFLSAYVLGVRRDGPLWNKSIVVEPRAGNLPRARGVVVTEFGPVPVSWTRNREGAMSVDFTVPPGTSAIVRLPRGTGQRSLQVDGKVQEAQFNPPYLTLSLPETTHDKTHRLTDSAARAVTPGETCGEAERGTLAVESVIAIDGNCCGTGTGWCRRARLMNQLQAAALNEGLRRKKGLWREAGRKQLESFRLTPWASRRRRDLLELVDRLNPTIAEVPQAVEQEVEKCPEAKPLRTHPLVGFQCGKQIASYQGLGPSEVQVVP